MLTNQNKQFIDSAEGFIVTMNLEPFFADKIKITNNILSSISKVEKQLIEMFQEFIATPKFKKVDLGFNKLNYNQAQQFVSVALDAETLGSRLPTFESADLQFNLIQQIIKVYNYLQNNLPKVTVRSMPDFVAADFLRMYRTLTNPATVLTDLEMGCLSTSQIELLKQFYPAYYSLITTTLTEVIVNATAEQGETFTIPYPKLKQMAILLQNATVPEDLQSLLQSNFTKENKTEQGSKKFELPASNPTQLQRLEAK